MASRTIFYTQNTLVENSTITDRVGAASLETNILNFRRQSRLHVTTVTGGIYAFRVDVGAATFQPQYYIFIDHNFSSVGSLDVKLYTSSVDDGTDFTTGAETITLSSATASDNILYNAQSYAHSRRYFKIELSSTPTTSTYLGNFFMLKSTDVFQTARDPSPIQQIPMSRRGQVVNESHGGSKFTVSRFGRRRMWRLKWDTVTDADLTILQNFEAAVEGASKPFVFTMDNGTTYYYGRFASDLVYNVGVDSDLNDVEFLIEEEV